MIPNHLLERLERTLADHQVGHDQSGGGEHSKEFIKGFAECVRILREAYERKAHV